MVLGIVAVLRVAAYGLSAIIKEENKDARKDASKCDRD